MNIEGARRVMETTSHETANQYLRFGWSLINQYVVAATDHQPATIRYVLASVRRLEDTRQVMIITDADDVNEYLALGWKLIDKHVTASDTSDHRNELFHFVLAWQSDEPPAKPGWTPEVTRQFDVPLDLDDEL
jgi:hypothetical protein